MSDEQDDPWDFWDQIGMHCAGYNSAIDADLIRVFIESDTSNDNSEFYSTQIAARLGLAENYVELLKYALCSANFCNYGTSPRGAWAEHGKQAELREKLLEWYERRWGEPFTASDPAAAAHSSQ